MSNRADLAVEYATRDWLVFPCHVNGKDPAARSGFNAGTTDLVTIRRWWAKIDYNIGIYCRGSGLFVVDLDSNPERGDPGISTYLELIAEYELPELEETYCVNTPHGCHVYYTTDLPLKQTVSELRPNIDTRSDGYVLAAGSEVDGVEYEHFGANEPLPIPDFLSAFFAKRPPPTPEQITKRAIYETRADDDQAERAAVGLVREVENAIEGERNTELNWAAFRAVSSYRSRSWKESTLERLVYAGIRVGLTESECRATVGQHLRKL